MTNRIDEENNPNKNIIIEVVEKIRRVLFPGYFDNSKARAEYIKFLDCFGFTEEVFAGMDECGYTDRETVKSWYDGFTFGSKTDIYNPWSILNYLDTGEI